MRSESWWRRAVRRGVVIGLAAAVIVLGAVALGAEDDPGGAPGRAVRLSSVDGQVQVAQGGEVLADHALVNTPLFEGTQVSTGEDGRAEIQFEDGSVARIPPDSSLTLSVLKPGEAEIDLESGMGYFELQDGGQGSPMRVRFGGSVVTASGFTVLRVNLDDGPGDLAVFSGNAHIDGTNGASMDVRGGESVSLNNLNLSDSIEPDSWDAWNSDRDQALTTSEVGETAAPSSLPNSENPAWNDLNTSGSWYNVPDQGYVWSPYEAENAGWDPYGMGYWMYTPAYGYVWVSGYQWGYMPYQCGAWNWYNSFGWGWAPGMCNTWWGGGGWYFNVGTMPRWYRLPMRPHGPKPRPVGGGPVRLANGGKVRLPVGQRPVIPVVSVVRNDPSNGLVSLPPRAGNHPIQIGGVVAEPLKPAPQPRAGLHRIPDTGGPVTTSPVRTFNPGSGATGRPAQPRQGYAPAPVVRSPGVPAQRPGYTPAPQPGGGRTTIPGSPRIPSEPVYRPAPPPRPSGGSAPVYRPAPAPAPRSAPAPAPHPSGGGGGGHPAASPHK
ncbi:MAG TPA: FecR domain-containing protein [Terracidiphilus sp.]